MLFSFCMITAWSHTVYSKGKRTLNGMLKRLLLVADKVSARAIIEYNSYATASCHFATIIPLDSDHINDESINKSTDKTSICHMCVARIADTVRTFLLKLRSSSDK